MSREAIAAVVEEAHRHGVKVSIHSRGSGSTRDSALAGVDWIFHADLATEDDLDMVAAAGIQSCRLSLKAKSGPSTESA